MQAHVHLFLPSRPSTVKGTCHQACFTQQIDGQDTEVTAQGHDSHDGSQSNRQALSHKTERHAQQGLRAWSFLLTIRKLGTAGMLPQIFFLWLKMSFSAAI